APKLNLGAAALSFRQFTEDRYRLRLHRGHPSPQIGQAGSLLLQLGGHIGPIVLFDPSLLRPRPLARRQSQRVEDLGRRARIVADPLILGSRKAYPSRAEL